MPGSPGTSNENKPRILLMGLRRCAIIYFDYLYVVLILECRSGKSSIQKVVFHKMSPNETLFLESTSKIVKNGIFFLSTTSMSFLMSYVADISNSSFVQFQIWDFPGQLDFFDPAFDSEV